MKSFMTRLTDLFPTSFLRLYSWWRIPLLFFVSPKIIELTEKRCVIKIPLTHKTRNHLRTMYFGSLCIGADCAGGLMALRLIQRKGLKISLIFKDFKADFLKRAEGDVFFTCEQGSEIAALVERAEASGQRENLPVQVSASVRHKMDKELIVANFVLTLSIKSRENH